METATCVIEAHQSNICINFTVLSVSHTHACECKSADGGARVAVQTAEGEKCQEEEDQEGREGHRWPEAGAGAGRAHYLDGGAPAAPRHQPQHCESAGTAAVVFNVQVRD